MSCGLGSNLSDYGGIIMSSWMQVVLKFSQIHKFSQQVLSKVENFFTGKSVKHLDLSPPNSYHPRNVYQWILCRHKFKFSLRVFVPRNLVFKHFIARLYQSDVSWEKVLAGLHSLNIQSLFDFPNQGVFNCFQLIYWDGHFMCVRNSCSEVRSLFCEGRIPVLIKG